MKALLFALLAVDAGYFAFTGAASKAIDSAAWLVLLALFIAESRFSRIQSHPGLRFGVRGFRLGAGVGVVIASLRYVLEDNALDAANSALWIGVVVLLETQFRYPQQATRHRRAFVAVAATLYGALFTLVTVWCWRGEWLDAYDALLWLIAFAALEINVAANRPAVAAVTVHRTRAGEGS